MTSAERSTLDTVLRIGERLGVPLLILVALLWMAREAGTALYSGAVVPVVQAHTQFLESTQDTLQRIGETQDRQTNAMQEIVTGQREITAILKDGARN
jgi:septal ring factor EnvC (AmiA/AmiB activator)